MQELSRHTKAEGFTRYKDRGDTKKRIVVRFDDKEFNELAEIAFNSKKPLAHVIRQLVQKALDD